MEGEFNNLEINNTPSTFTGKTDNIKTIIEAYNNVDYNIKQIQRYWDFKNN